MYRDPAARAAAEPAPRRVIVSRPEPTPEVGPIAAPLTALGAGRAPARAPTYWERHALFARHPRALGGVLAVLGGGISVTLLAAGASYSTRAAIVGPIGFFVGMWCLLFGCVLHEDGHPSQAWMVGFFTCIAVGLIAGIGLLVSLGG